MLRIRDIMSAPPVTVAPDTSIRDASELLSTELIGGAPVVVGTELVGMLTAHDLMEFIASLATEPAEVRARSEHGILEDHTVEEAMRRPPLRTVEPSTSVRRAAEMLSTERLHRLPVIEHGKLVGIVSTTDIVRAVAARRLEHSVFVFPPSKVT